MQYGGIVRGECGNVLNCIWVSHGCGSLWSVHLPMQDKVVNCYALGVVFTSDSSCYPCSCHGKGVAAIYIWRHQSSVTTMEVYVEISVDPVCTNLANQMNMQEIFSTQ